MEIIVWIDPEMNDGDSFCVKGPAVKLRGIVTDSEFYVFPEFFCACFYGRGMLFRRDGVDGFSCADCVYVDNCFYLV